ncbi:nucleolus and neural progenitor protein [Hoplias malabaricus]|uniref:nucleolus and neural progenitor protein n=1 Tax=Hoplias malabaricus TaxID=27720 RepID=UPI0034636950
MAAELWNRVELPVPSAASTSAVSFSPDTANIINTLISDCDDVLKLLQSGVLRTEIRVLYRILYVVNNGLRQHKPFRAIKQVQQCVKRLDEMKLQGVLLDLQGLCPNKTQREMGVDVGFCNVPSQPLLEWTCLKLLGASSLLCRTLDQCTKAFSLTRRHLRLAEFILLNLVIVSMLSRLWVFFRGILRALVPVYRKTVELLQLVAQSCPMAFLTSFSLPPDLGVFLSPVYSQMLSTAKKTFSSQIPSVLFGLFEEEKEKQEDGEEQEMMQMLGSEKMVKSSVDLGQAVLRRKFNFTGSSSGLDIKSMLQCTVNKQVESNTSDPAVVQKKRTFLKLLRTMTSFSEMSFQLKEMMDWCRRRKLTQERRVLACFLLQCRRRMGLDADGIRVQKTLRMFCGRIQCLFFKGTHSKPPPSSLSFQRRTQSCFRSRFTTIMAHYGSVRNRYRVSRTHTSFAKDPFKVTVKSSKKNRRKVKVPNFQQESQKEEWRGEALQSQSGGKTEGQKPHSVKNSEIDDIFSSIGF